MLRDDDVLGVLSYVTYQIFIKISIEAYRDIYSIGWNHEIGIIFLSEYISETQVMKMGFYIDVESRFKHRISLSIDDIYTDKVRLQIVDLDTHAMEENYTYYLNSTTISVITSIIWRYAVL